MKKTHIIDQGYAMEFFVHGVFVFIAGAVCFIPALPGWFHIIGVGMILKGIIAFMIKTGIEFDGEGRRVRKFNSFLGKKWGKWISIRPEYSARLDFTNEKARIMGPAYLGDKEVQARSFDVIIETPGGDMKLYDFLEYKPAEECLNITGKQFGINISNRFKDLSAG